MGTLWFLGLGLDDERGLSARALDVLRASEVFAEEYTAVASPGTLERLGLAPDVLLAMLMPLLMK